ncbi:hypothetical protein J1614_002661 [Plenodomus biglobosus]|nr:hypothetical protein J1614_002661 [Plenodomus biglobosus]
MAIGETDHQAVFLSVAWSIFGLALLLSGARVYGRFVMTRQPAADDYLMLLTLFTSTTMMIAATLLTSFIIGRHSWNITQDDRQKVSQAYYAAVACFILTIALTKATILLQLAKIFRSLTRGALYWICWGLIGFVILWTLGTVLGDLIVCRPPAIGFWGSRTLMNQCSVTNWTVQGVISVALDCILMVLPVPVVRQLHIPFRQKSFAFALLAVGSVGCFFSIVRTVSLHMFSPSNDATYDLFRIPLWFILEALIAVCCGALMGSKQLILHWFPSLSPKSDDILPPAQLNAMPFNHTNCQIHINLDDEDMKKFRLESIMYRLAVIGSPWAQIPRDTTSATEQGANAKNTTGHLDIPIFPSPRPSQPRPLRKSKGPERHDSTTGSISSKYRKDNYTL